MTLSKAIQDSVEQDLRLYLLQLLADNPGYRYNLGLLRNLICEGVTAISLAQCRELAVWLADHKLVIFSGERCGNAWATDIVQLTPAGKEVALGTQVIAGVRRPEPNELKLWPHVEIPPLLPKE